MFLYICNSKKVNASRVTGSFLSAFKQKNLKQILKPYE